MDPLINGKCFDWADVTIGVTGMENIEISEISYDDEQEAELIYGRGGKPRGYGTGNQKNSVKVTVHREDFNEMCRVIKKRGKSFYSFSIDKITISYANEDSSTSTDVLRGVKFTKRSLKAAQGDKEMKVDLEGFAYKGIKIAGLDA